MDNIFGIEPNKIEIVIDIITLCVVAIWTVISFFVGPLWKNKITKNLESLKSNLDMINKAYETDYKFYRTEKLKATIELHKKTTDFYNSAYAYVLLIDGKSDIEQFVRDNDYDRRRLEYQKSLVSLLDCHDYCLIFLEKELCGNVMKLFHKISNSCNKFHDIYLRTLQHNDEEEVLYNQLQGICGNFKFYYKEYNALIESFKTIIQPIVQSPQATS